MMHLFPIDAINEYSSIHPEIDLCIQQATDIECEEALAELQKVVDIKSLGELSEEQFEEYKGAIGSEVRMRRAKHAVYENQRTLKAVEALKENDVETFGKLMNASHVSLRDDYEVTGIELDTLVEEAWKVDGVIGSRMQALADAPSVL
jgi:galactokinase